MNNSNTQFLLIFHIPQTSVQLEMLRVRLKMGPARNKEWTCCFGLHVRTATIMIGMWHLFLNVLTLGILAAIIRNPAMMQELENGYDDYGRVEALPTPLSKIDPPYAYRDHSLNYRKFTFRSWFERIEKPAIDFNDSFSFVQRMLTWGALCAFAWLQYRWCLFMVLLNISHHICYHFSACNSLILL